MAAKCLVCVGREERIKELRNEIERLQGLVDECELIGQRDDQAGGQDDPRRTGGA